jgi:hypothetical protein
MTDERIIVYVSLKDLVLYLILVVIFATIFYQAAVRFVEWRVSIPSVHAKWCKKHGISPLAPEAERKHSGKP